MQSTATNRQPRPDRVSGFWAAISRFLEKLFGGPAPEPPPPSPPPPAPERLVRQGDSEAPITVPALGDVFDFHIIAMVTWHSEGLSQEMLTRCSQQLAGQARRELTHQCADVARHFRPDRPEQLERALNQRFGDNPFWRCRWSGPVLTCRAKVRVRLDGRLKAQLQPLWEQRLAMEFEHETAMRRAELVADLGHRWLAILEQLQSKPLAAGAARLTEPRFADVVQQISDEQRHLRDELTGLLRDAASQQGGLAAYETAQMIDMVTRTLGDQGLVQPLAPQDPTPGRPAPPKDRPVPHSRPGGSRTDGSHAENGRTGRHA